MKSKTNVRESLGTLGAAVALGLVGLCAIGLHAAVLRLITLGRGSLPGNFALHVHGVWFYAMLAVVAFAVLACLFGKGRLGLVAMTAGIGMWLLSIWVVGSLREPSNQERANEVLRKVMKGGGESNLISESRVLFARLSPKTNFVMASTDYDRQRFFDGLATITELGDSIRYNPGEPDRIEIRVYHSHWNLYFITLLKPDEPPPLGFRKIVGNVGFLRP